MTRFLLAALLVTASMSSSADAGFWRHRCGCFSRCCYRPACCAPCCASYAAPCCQTAYVAPSCGCFGGGFGGCFGGGCFGNGVANYGPMYGSGGCGCGTGIYGAPAYGAPVYGAPAYGTPAAPAYGAPAGPTPTPAPATSSRRLNYGLPVTVINPLRRDPRSINLSQTSQPLPYDYARPISVRTQYPF